MDIEKIKTPCSVEMYNMYREFNDQFSIVPNCDRISLTPQLVITFYVPSVSDYNGSRSSGVPTKDVNN